MEVSKEVDQDLVVFKEQEDWKEMFDRFLQLPDRFKPRCYMFTNSNPDRQHKFRVVVDKVRQLLMVLGDSLPSHQGVTLSRFEGQIVGRFKDKSRFNETDLIRLVNTIQSSMRL